MSVQDNGSTAVADDATSNGVTKRLLIDGELVTTDRTFASYNPATGDVVGHAPDAGVEEAEAAIKAARRAFDTTTWSTDVEFRAKCLDQLHQALRDNVEELRELTIAEVGATAHPDPRQSARRADRDREVLRRTAPEHTVHRRTRRGRDPWPAPSSLGREGSRRRRRGDRRLQLPDTAGDGEAAGRARRRLHGGAQGRTRHPAASRRRSPSSSPTTPTSPPASSTSCRRRRSRPAN